MNDQCLKAFKQHNCSVHTIVGYIKLITMTYEPPVSWKLLCNFFLNLFWIPLQTWMQALPARVFQHISKDRMGCVTVVVTHTNVTSPNLVLVCDLFQVIQYFTFTCKWNYIITDNFTEITSVCLMMWVYTTGISHHPFSSLYRKAFYLHWQHP